VEKRTSLEAVCREIGDALHGLARARASGALSEADFVQAVLVIEEREITPHGFTLSASNTLDNWTVFTVRVQGCRQSCATFEFLPETGEFRTPASKRAAYG